MILAISPTQLLAITKFCCYIIALAIAIYVSMSIDYKKIIKARSNLNYYVTAFAISASLTFLIGEFLFNILTMFM